MTDSQGRRLGRGTSPNTPIPILCQCPIPCQCVCSSTEPNVLRCSDQPCQTAPVAAILVTLQAFTSAMMMEVPLMRYAALLLVACLCVDANASNGAGKVLDVHVSQNNILVVRMVRQPSSAPAPACAVWEHNYGKPLGAVASSAFISMLLAAQASGQSVLIQGSGSCVAGTGSEEILQMNVGPWGQ